MTEPSPEIVAAADLSPVSPSPLHNTYSLPQILPDLQIQAENPNVVPQGPSVFRTAAAAMMGVDTEPSDTIVVGGVTDSEGQEESILDEDSVDLYGEDEGGQEQNNAIDAAGNDDYLKTFDSPAREQDEEQEQAEAEEAQQQQQDVPEAQESMNISEASDAMPDQSPAASTSADITNPSPSTNDSQPDQPTATTETASPAKPEPEPEQTSTSAAPSASEAAPVAPASPASDQSSGSDPISLDSDADADVDADGDGDGDGEPQVAEPTQQEAATQPSEDVQMEDDPNAIDIQKLVDQITAKAEAEAGTEADAPTQEPAEQKAAMPAQPSEQKPSSPSSMGVDLSSLPSKPSIIQPPSGSSQIPQHGAPGTGFSSYSTGSLAQSPSSTVQPSQYAASGAPGTSPTAQNFSSSLPPGYNAASAFVSYPNAQAYPPAAPAHMPASALSPGFDGNQAQQEYDAFLADERKHMSEAKWEKFPEGSRIFIGNLSQERVSKRDVFELFHQYGPLAQISLKSAYGFVQYHTVADAQAAMNNLQGAEVKGRKINLEISRNQKQKKDRDHSPERKGRDRGGRGADRGADRIPDRGGDRIGDRYDGRDQNRRRSRDDYRPVRSPSPRRDEHRARDDFDRDHGHYETTNRKHNRSRSPAGRFGRNGQEAYRRRSPSPYGRRSQEADRLDIPRRYGADVPDVQILLMQDVHKDFIDWVQRAFWDRGLKTNAMFLNTRFPREAVIQRQVLEGVQGVVELDMRAQNTAKIPLQVFDRSAGNNVRYDQYQDLDPSIAAQLVLRTKSTVAPQPAYLPPVNYVPQPYPQPPQQQYAQPPAATPNLSSLMGQIGHLDSAAVQTLIASLQQGQQAAPLQSSRPPVMPHHPPQPMASNQQIDMNALLSNLGAAAGNNAAAATMPPAMSGYGISSYPVPGNAMHPPGHAPPASNGQDPSQQVQNIMAQLARIRQ